MKKLLVLLLINGIVGMVSAQEIVGTLGVSFHSLEKLKSFQRQYINDAVVPLKSTQSFPPYLQYGFTMKFPATKFSFGTNVYVTSTAARSVYEDYSGQVRVDQSLRCIGLSFFSSLRIEEYTKGKLMVYSMLGWEFSKLDVDVDVEVNYVRDHNGDTFNAAAPYVELGLEYEHDLSNNFFLHFNGGVHVSKGAMLVSTSDDSDFEEVNWTGGKLMAGIGYRF